MLACETGRMTTLDIASDNGARDWRSFVVSFAAALVLLGSAASGFVSWLDPYGLRVKPGRAPGPLMDINQRFMYPQIARSGAYDAAVFGTSTSRLLDPRALDAAFGARFANLAMNAATPFEQTELARLFLRENATRAIILGLDANWCDGDADKRKLTFRPFPPWLYRPGTPWGTIRQINWQSLATAAQVLMARLGLAKPRMRQDGFAIFTPPERSYDAARASSHIHSGKTALDDPDEPRAASRDQALTDAPMPALVWLDALLAETPPDATRLVAFMPVHAVVQGRPGTALGEREATCKARVAEIGRRRGATVVDFRLLSDVTTTDANYWDALHYRLPIADKIVAGLKTAQMAGRDDADGFFKVLAHP